MFVVWRQGLTRLVKNCSGAVAIYTAILMPVFLGFLGLGVDVSLWHLEKRETQKIAGAAAMAAALEFMRTGDEASIEPSALISAGQNGFDVRNDQITIFHPPVSGILEGNMSAAEVIVTTASPTLLSSLVVNQIAAVGSRAVAMAEMSDTCLWSLEPEASGAIKISGGSVVDFGCGVFANSSDPDAIQISGSGSCLIGSEIKIVGDSNEGCINPQAVTGVLPREDPLAGLPPPPISGCDTVRKTVITGSRDATLSPGTYCGSISILTSGTITLLPGLYILDGAGLTIGAGATVQGEGVTIYLSADGTVADNIAITSGAMVELSAPDSGTYAGILFYQDRLAEDNIQHNFTGGAFMDLEGILYFPNQDVKFSGGSVADSSNSMIISRTIEFTGHSYLDEFEPASKRLAPLLITVALVE